jgi:hypothetical protein
VGKLIEKFFFFASPPHERRTRNFVDVEASENAEKLILPERILRDNPSRLMIIEKNEKSEKRSRSERLGTSAIVRSQNSKSKL